MNGIIKLLAMCLSVACSSFTGMCADRYVVSSGGSDSGEGGIEASWATVSYAVKNSNDGDVIHVGAGTWTWAGPVAKGVSIIGTGDGTILSASSNVSFDNENLVVSGVSLRKAVGNWTGYSILSGTVTNCTVSGCKPTSSWVNTAVRISGGILVDCRITGNTAGNGNAGSGAVVLADGSATIRNCLFHGNDFVTNGSSPSTDGSGALFISPTYGSTVMIENTTVAGNYGGCSGGVQIGSNDSPIQGNVVIRGCVFANNVSPFDYVIRGIADRCSNDVYLNADGDGSVIVENSHFGTCPSSLSTHATFIGNTTYGPAGFVDEQNGNYELNTGSPAYSFGYHAAVRAPGFACAVKTPSADRGIGSVPVKLEALVFNAPEGNAKYEWDLDGDGEYDTMTYVPTVNHTFSSAGWRAVGLKVTIGIVSATSAVENVAYVCPHVIYVYPYKKNSTGNNVFPYNTPYNAATTLSTAQKAALPGSRICVGGSISGGANLYGCIVYGNGQDSGSVVAGSILLYDNASISGLKIYGQRAAPGIRMTGETSCISNCLVNGMWFSTSGSPAGLINNGIITHSKFTECHCNYGPVVSICGNSTVRNCVFTKNKLDNGKAYQRTGIIHVYGNAVFENNTVCGNYSEKTDNTETHSSGLYIPNGSPVIRNNIVRNNFIHGTPGSTTAIESNYICTVAASPVVSHNNSTEGFGQYATTGDPLFVDAASGDFHISQYSPCRNSGLNKSWQRRATEYTGTEPRRQGGTVDVGAYEYQDGVPIYGIGILIK